MEQIGASMIAADSPDEVRVRVRVRVQLIADLTY
jgi:hypothetical protein